MAQHLSDTESIKAFNQTLADEFRANGGRVGGRFRDADLLLLTTTGAKTGQPRLSPLAYVRIDDRVFIVGSFGGADVNPGWVHNLRTNPSAHIEVGTQSSEVIAHELSPAERAEWFPKIAEITPGFAEAQAKTSRVIPVFELRPVT